MRKIILFVVFMLPAMALAQDVVLPAKMSKEDLTGKVFDGPGVVVTEEDGIVERGVRSMRSNDEKFVTGMFKADAGRYEYNEPFGVNEFMFFLEGSVTLTSSDGSVMVIGPGEAVTIPKDWTGVWEDSGYTKIYVIYKE